MIGSESKQKKILLVGLNYNQYDTMISNELRRLGYDVEMMTYQGAVPIRKLFRSPLRICLFYWLVYVATLPKRLKFAIEVRAKFKTTQPDALLAINPSFLPFSLLSNAMRRLTAVWLMDPVALYPQNAKFLRRAGFRFTYDPDDAVAYAATFLPLFADMQIYDISNQNAAARRYLFAFVGALYENRAQILDKLCAIAAGKGREVYVGGAFVRLTNVEKDLAAGKYPHLRKVFVHRRHSHQEIVAIYKQAEFIFNAHQVGHQGLSMRTFEALALGCTQIIDIFRPAEFPFNKYPQAFRNIADFIAEKSPAELDKLLTSSRFSAETTDVSLTSRLEVILKAMKL